MAHAAPLLLLLIGVIGAAGCLREFDAPRADEGAPADAAATPPDLVGATTIPSPTPDLSGAAGDGSTGAPSGRDTFNNNVLPIMQMRCAPCHGVDNGIGPGFIKPPAYDSLIAYPGMITRDPLKSLLITKGPHNGVLYFPNGENLTVLAWLQIEAAALPASIDSAVATPPQVIQAGANVVALDPLGADFLGASITFDATVLTAALKVTNLNVHATGPSGLHIVHPLFVGVKSGVKTPDPIDSFDGYDFTVPQFQTAPFGPGTLLLTNVGQGDGVAIAFQSITKWAPGMQQGGCKDVASFTQFAQPALTGNPCVGCHGAGDGGRGDAQNAMDLSHVTDLTQMGQAIACAQVLNRVTPATPDASQIFRVTQPGQMVDVNHQFTFNGDMNAWSAFKTAVSTWIVKEQ